MSSVVPASTTNPQGLTTNKRTIDTTVIIDDGHIVVLGGLIDEQVTESVTAVPLLSKLPLLGEIFTFRDRKKKKTNLMVFLRPVIVRSGEDMLNVTQERYDYMRFHEQKSAMDRHLILPRYAPPILPEYRQPPPKPAPEPKEETAKDTQPPALDSAPKPVETLPGTPETAPPLPPVTAAPPPVVPASPAVSEPMGPPDTPAEPVAPPSP